MDDRAVVRHACGAGRSANLQVRGDGLFASLWGGGGVQDHNTATDADSDIALALLFAARHFGDSRATAPPRSASSTACGSRT